MLANITHGCMDAGEFLRCQRQLGSEMKQVGVGHAFGLCATRVLAPVLLAHTGERGHLLSRVTQTVFQGLKLSGAGRVVVHGAAALPTGRA